MIASVRHTIVGQWPRNDRACVQFCSDDERFTWRTRCVAFSTILLIRPYAIADGQFKPDKCAIKQMNVPILSHLIPCICVLYWSQHIIYHHHGSGTIYVVSFNFGDVCKSIKCKSARVCVNGWVIESSDYGANGCVCEFELRSEFTFMTK